MRSRGILIGALAMTSLLLLAPVAESALSESYSGKTSQKQAVSFTISLGAVRHFRITVLDRCPDGHTLSVTGNYPPMRITKGKFGGSFVPTGGHPGEHAALSGKIAGREATGRINDTSYSSREGRLCHGSATFTASRK